MNRVVYRDADAVVTLSKRMAHRLKSNYCQQELNVAVIPPWADVHSITLSLMMKIRCQKGLTTGEVDRTLFRNMGSVTILIVCCKLLAFAHREDILFLFIGTGECWQMPLILK